MALVGNRPEPPHSLSIRSIGLQTDPEPHPQPFLKATASIYATPDASFETYKKFAEELDTAAETILQRKSRYDRVRVLLTYWKTEFSDRKHLEATALQLETVFRKQYEFQTEMLELDDDAYTNLNLKFSGLTMELKKKTTNELFILYYGGHGYYEDKDVTQPRWTAADSEDILEVCRPVDWRSLQRQVAEMACDVFFLFDCCYAEGMMDDTLKWGGTCQLLGASPLTEKAGGLLENSFTVAITALLVDERTKHGGVDVLRLGTIASSSEWQKKAKLLKKATPRFRKSVYTSRRESVVPGRSGYFIPLIPLEKEASDTASSIGSSTTLQDTLGCSDARILFKFILSSPPDLEEFKLWLANRPGGIVGIKVDAAAEEDLKVKCHGLFGYNSNLAIMSMPIWLWHALPANTTYEKIAIVRSGNLLEASQSDSGTQTKALEYSSVGIQAKPLGYSSVVTQTQPSMFFRKRPKRKVSNPELIPKKRTNSSKKGILEPLEGTLTPKGSKKHVGQEREAEVEAKMDRRLNRTDLPSIISKLPADLDQLVARRLTSYGMWRTVAAY